MSWNVIAEVGQVDFRKEANGGVSTRPRGIDCQEWAS
jgi:hypothetical protein